MQKGQKQTVLANRARRQGRTPVQGTKPYSENAASGEGRESVPFQEARRKRCAKGKKGIEKKSKAPKKPARRVFLKIGVQPVRPKKNLRVRQGRRY